MARYFNTTLGLSMLPDGRFFVEALTWGEARAWLCGAFENVVNPSHTNSLDAICRHLNVDGRLAEKICNAKGGRVILQRGDECLVAQIENVPRETREFTDEEVKNASFAFRLVRVPHQ